MCEWTPELSDADWFLRKRQSLCHLHAEGWSRLMTYGRSLRELYSQECVLGLLQRNMKHSAYFCHYISCRERETPQQALLVLDDIVLFSVFSQNCTNLTSWLVWSPNIAHELKSSLNLTCDVIVIMFYSWPQSVLLKERYKGFWINLICVMGMCSKTSQRWWVANDFSFAIFLS